MSKKYKNEGKHLREQMTTLKLASETVDPAPLEAFVACRLNPLDKCPGICPIGIGEILHRIIGKTIGWALKTIFNSLPGSCKQQLGCKVMPKLPFTT